VPASIASDPNPSNDRAPAEVRVADGSVGLTPLALLPVLPATGFLPLAARSPASLAGLALGGGLELVLSILLVAFTRRWPGPKS
jgi:hypothetical protein